MKGFRPQGHMRGRGRDGFTNGFGPMRFCDMFLLISSVCLYFFRESEFVRE